MAVPMLAAALCLTACGGDDEKDGNGNGGGSVPDPEGTILIAVRNGHNGSTEVNLSGVGYIGISNQDNFTDRYGYSIEFCVVGWVSGLGNVRVAPELGWALDVAALKGYGYLVRNKDATGHYTYARMYVVDYMVNTSGGIIGAYVKYQSPFIPENLPE